mgnify:CR=1 FL=1
MIQFLSRSVAWDASQKGFSSFYVEQGIYGRGKKKKKK